jgi:hypothetical protein
MLHRFPSFVSILGLAVAVAAQEAATTAAPGLDYQTANRLAQAPRWLAMKSGAFDTTLAMPAMATELLAAPDDGQAYRIVQLAGPVTEADKAALVALGLELFDYVPNHAFVVRGTAAQVARGLAQGALVWTEPLHPGWRIEPELLLATGEARVTVLGFAGIDPATLQAQATAAGATVLQTDEQVGRWSLLVTASPAVIRALARCRDVQWVEPESVVTERNDTMTWSVQTGVSGNRRLWTLGLRGEGQVIGHQDSAISTTSCYFLDPANAVGPSHRKLVYRSGTGTGSSHGTHTAGTVAGDAQPVNGSTANRGLAYAAKIAHSSDYSASVWAARANTHRANGARVYTNSWGNDGTTAYNTHCNAIDAFSWTNEDDLVLFAETNTATLKNPENAKNLVAVGNALNGASYNSKGGGGVGPTSDGRRKPDLFAPGTSIVSASTASCGTASSTGTSMACPAATAASALIRQYFVDGFYPSGVANAADSLVPTGALIKAVLVNTSQDMTGVAGYPNNTEGWGRIVLDESLHFTGDSGRLWVADVRRAQGLTTGTSRTYSIDVLDAARPLEVTLAFTDFAGTVNAANAVVNNLDLVVQAPDGTQYRGNLFASGWSISGGSADLINNVERVAVQVPIAGTWTFTVTGQNVPQGPSGFGLCATGRLSGGFAIASTTLYGAGKPGLSGVPVISAPRPTLPQAWQVAVAGTRPNQFGLMVYGESETALPFDGGTVLATPVTLELLLTNGIGFAVLPVTIPNTPSLNGANTYWQFWMPNDPGAAGDGWSASRGLRAVIGN